MEIPNLSNPSVKPRIIRSLLTTNGSFFNNKDLCCMPCSFVSVSGTKCKLPLLSRRQNNLTTICRFRRETDVNVLSGCRFYSQQSGIPIPFRQAPKSCLLKPCQVKNEDSKGTLNSENSILDQQKLERELQIAIKEENYAQAAKIRDNLKLFHEDSKTAVLAANSRFYNSFRNGDLSAMEALWLKSENVSLVHPGVKGIYGYELVMASWELVWADYSFPLDIEVKDVNVHVRGDVGYVTCAEMVRTNGKRFGRQFATNVFEKVGGQWFMSLHHASDVDLLRHMCGSF